jgi:hypothetical protein
MATSEVDACFEDFICPRDSLEMEEVPSPASGRMLSTVALRDTDRATSRLRNAKPRAALERDSGFPESEPTRRPRECSAWC